MIEFLSPLGALVALLALVPLVAAKLRERRHATARATLGLADPGPRARRPAAIAVVAVFALLALAATQPVLRHDDPVLARADAEAYLLVDVSRSMLASAAPGSESRFDRAVRLALRIGAALPAVPLGVASITDRPLPHLFPTADRDAFAGVVTRAIGVDRPPPSESEGSRATELGSVAALGRDNYFSARSVRRLVVLLTDGESVPFDPGEVAGRLRDDGVDLVIVRLRSASERIYGPDGAVEAGYRPDASSDGAVAALAASTGAGRVFSEDDVDSAIGAARAALGSGPVVEAVARERSRPLGGWIALAAAVPLAVLLVRHRPGAGRAGPAPTRLQAR